MYCNILITQVLILFQTEDDIPSNEILNWADGCLLVYAITDRISFNYVRKVKELLCDIPVALVGNKGDMVHLRQVSTDEGIKRLIVLSMFLH